MEAGSGTAIRDELSVIEPEIEPPAVVWFRVRTMEALAVWAPLARVPL